MWRESNIFDPIQQTLDPRVFKGDDPRPSIVNFIRRKIYSIFRDTLVDDPERYFDLYLTGSLTTYQYSKASDCDISVFPDYKSLGEVVGEPDPNELRKELIAIVTTELDGTSLPGSSHPIQAFVVNEGIRPEDMYRAGERSAWSFQTEHWVVPPEHERTHDVAKEMPDLYQRAQAQAEKMTVLLDQRDIDGAREMFAQIHKKRTLDEHAGLGDFSEGNIEYKWLLHAGLFDRLKEEAGVKIAKLAGETRPQLLRRIQTLPPDQSKVVADLGGGYYLHQLANNADVAREGQLANHCWQSGPQGDPTQHYSVRDADGASHASFYYSPAGVKHNSGVSSNYFPTTGDYSTASRLPIPEEDLTNAHIMGGFFGPRDQPVKPEVNERLTDWVNNLPGKVYASQRDGQLGTGMISYIPNLFKASKIANDEMKVIYDFQKDHITLGTVASDDDLPSGHIIVGTYDGSNVHLHNVAKQWINANYFKRLWVNSFPTRPIDKIFFDHTHIPTRSIDQMTYTQKLPFLTSAGVKTADQWRDGKDWKDFIKDRGIIVDFQFGEAKDDPVEGKVVDIDDDSVRIELNNGDKRTIPEELLKDIKFKVRDEKTHVSTFAEDSFRSLHHEAGCLYEPTDDDWSLIKLARDWWSCPSCQKTSWWEGNNHDWVFRWGWNMGSGILVEDEDYFNQSHSDMASWINDEYVDSDKALEDSFFGYGELDTKTGVLRVDTYGYDYGESGSAPEEVYTELAEYYRARGFPVTEVISGKVRP